jgi:hypothetical protein
MKKRKKAKYELDKYFLLNWKRLYLLAIFWIISIISHKSFYTLFGFESVVFFIILMFITPGYFFISFIYTLYRHLVKVYEY